ncbi:nuclear transport factor 2 family protein [Pseudoalteromonas sp. MMG005]|uniref:nuclear transport factor 2 family protein n=1 Tax=Pseudoalteromonas sp. MMG005 TaxID=2822682 RepID=UPI001B39DDA1|nr:nuclear transport factor 2 family protein [Pseudoalteromonas sp. MMG005]MBQ4846820.1 nuclear transport factor 2 family protein [Pseudoalteromonas sp. MMG005]
MGPILDRFIGMYDVLRIDNLAVLADVYHRDITFVDPLHQVEGLADLTQYFAHLYTNVSAIHFEIEDKVAIDNYGFVYWQMRYIHPRLNSGCDIAVNGHSKLMFKEEKVIHHRDYFDVGELLYRHLPVLGSVIKMVDRKASGK